MLEVRGAVAVQHKFVRSVVRRRSSAGGLHDSICRHQGPARPEPRCRVQQVILVLIKCPRPPPPSATPDNALTPTVSRLHSRPASLAAAARLALALTDRGHAPKDASPAWKRVQRMAELHQVDASLSPAITAAQHAPAYVRAHYLLSLLHWLLAVLGGKSKATGRTHGSPALENGAVALHDPAPAVKRKRKRTSKGASDAATDAAASDANKDGVSTFSNAIDHDTRADAAAATDAGVWWLLTAVLLSGALPQQEVQAGVLLKPLVLACQAATQVDVGTGATQRRVNAACPVHCTVTASKG